MSINWQFRPNTQDEDIYQEVYVKNCYRLPDDMSGLTVIDIGANIGCFTVACLDRGAERVYAFEPDAENVIQMEKNLSGHSADLKVRIFQRFVVGDNSGIDVALVSREYDKFGDVLLTGGLSLFSYSDKFSGKFPVKVSSLNEIISVFCKDSRVWIKLDCEGSEYQILSSDLPWDRIERIFGECHDYRDKKFSRDTKPVEVFPGAFGSLKPNQQSLVQYLIDKGYSVQTLDNPDDDRLALFFASRVEGDWVDVTPHQDPPGSKKIFVPKGFEPEFRAKNVAVLTPFRNARRYLQLYFQQIASLKSALESEGMRLRLVAAEGDSLDGTRERIIELADIYHIPLEIVDTTHGHMAWGSVEDPIRMKVMSDVMNKALERVQESDDVVVWIMSDLEWKINSITTLIKLLSFEDNIYAPLVLSQENKFYDTWAFRKNGERFYSKYPYHKDFENCCTMGNMIVSDDIDSAGTCLVMNAKTARSNRATNQEAVSFCQNSENSVTIRFDCTVVHAPAQQYRLLWIGDAVCISGFSKVSHSMFPILSEAGYELDIIATNYQGTPHNYPYRVWPAGDDDSGAYRMQQLLSVAAKQDKQYNAIIVLDDPWNVPRITRALEDLRENHDIKNLPPVVAWVTVDGRNINAEQLNSTDLYHVVASTEFGAYEIKSGGPKREDISVVPFGVNTSIYKPLDKTESRKLVSSKEIPIDAFIVGTVSTNQLRKRLDLVLQYFAEWINHHRIENSYLYLCLGASNYSGCDILSLIRYYGLRKKVILNTSLLSEPALAHVYSSFDVFISFSQGEGFGLCALEAMACGVPCVLSNWSGYSSWVPDDCAVKVSCSSTALSSPLNSQAYVIGGVADRQETINALHKLYTFLDMRDRLRENGLSLASRMSWKDTGEKLLSVVEKVIAQDKAGRFEAKSA